MSEELAGFVALIIVYVGGYMAQAVRGRKTRAQVNETETLMVQMRAEVSRLTSAVADKDVVIKELRSELAQLSHIKIMYDQLRESYTLLQSSHDALALKVDELSAAMGTLSAELGETKRAYEDAIVQLAEERARRQAAEAEVKTLHAVLRYFGDAAQARIAHTGGETPDNGPGEAEAKE